MTRNWGKIAQKMVIFVQKLKLKVGGKGQLFNIAVF